MYDFEPLAMDFWDAESDAQVPDAPSKTLM